MNYLDRISVSKISLSSILRSSTMSRTPFEIGLRLSFDKGIDWANSSSRMVSIRGSRGSISWAVSPIPDVLYRDCSQCLGLWDHLHHLDQQDGVHKREQG